MKILVAYATKSGTCKMAAEQLKNQLSNHEVTLADLAETTPVVGDFDYIVLGGPIRFNKAHKALRRFLRATSQELEAVPHTLFLCCAFAEQFENYLERTYPAALLQSADEAVYFGGELDPAKQRGLEKWLTKMMRNAILESEEDDAALPGFLPEHVRLLGDRLRVK
jgi:menaquinone-dependent protoporphyrinogen oxidase